MALRPLTPALSRRRERGNDRRPAPHYGVTTRSFASVNVPDESLTGVVILTRYVPDATVGSTLTITVACVPS